MHKRLGLAVIFWTLFAASAPAQEASLPADAKASFHLKGVLVSQTSRTALVNGRVSREGDRVGGALILAIDESSVWIRMGSRELVVHAGATVRADQYAAAVAIPRDVSRPGRISEQAAIHGSVRSQATAPSGQFTAEKNRRVAPGETLSGITEPYVGNGVTLDQMMIALFEANPQAFGGNINVLFADAALRIPAADELQHRPPATAAAEVRSQMQAWRSDGQAPASWVETVADSRYGPVDSGDTLSEIAARLLHEDVTLDQMMVALFAANPQAFNGNVNVLFAGVMLRIPAGAELQRLMPETATAEVLRQTDGWRVDRRSGVPDLPAEPYMSIASATSTVPPAARIGQPLAFASASDRSAASNSP